MQKEDNNTPEPADTSGVEAAFLMLMAWLHNRADFNPQMMGEQEVQDFVRKTAGVLDKAVDYAVGERPMDEISIRRLKESNYVFSGIKTFHELNEAFPALMDEAGEIKPFEQFLNDVQKVNENYNRLYLQAEYNFACASSGMAAKWKQFEADGKRYLLQYRTAGDARVRKSHRLMHNITLPITSRFWDWYFPPNGWNCRCNVVQVRRGKYPETNEQEAMNLGSQATAGKHQEMMRFNPGKQMTTFPAYNAYTISKCRDCKYNGTLKLAAKIPDNELCQACRVVRSMKKEDIKATVRKAKPLQGTTISHAEIPTEIRITGAGIKEWTNQPHKHFREKNEMLLNIKEVLSQSIYLGVTDNHKGIKRVVGAHIFETELCSDKTWIIIREYDWGELALHSITDSGKILEYIKKK